ncbi:MAG: hypothetical protein SOZ38_08390, partial [Oscillospiraceae bacterium]|nr:hypothetical protein [Oscillospiraceae bacterium]
MELTSIPSVFEPDINYTVKLSEDVVFESKMPEIPKKCSVTIDLNGHDILFKHEIENSLDICTTNYKEHNNEYMGLITNNGSLNIVGEGEISAYIADYNYIMTKESRNFDDLMAKCAAVINNGYLKIGTDACVNCYTTVTISDGTISNPFIRSGYADLFVYGFAVMNNGESDICGELNTKVISMSYAGGSANSYHSAAAYGIFGGSVNIYGGKISADAGSGAAGSSSSCREKNKITELAVGVFSNDLNISGNVQIDADVSAWMSTNQWDCWKDGIVYQVSAGVMYEGKNYPKIDSGCSISAGYSRLDNAQIIIPGSDKYSTEKSYTVLSPDACKNQYRFAASVAGIHCLSQSAYAENDSEEVMDSGWFNS